MFNRRELIDKIKGPFFTIFTPFSEDLQIDYKSLENYIESLYFNGGRLFYVMAYNSRYSQLDNSEIYELNKFCIHKVKSLDKENLIIVGDPIHCSTKTSSEFAIAASAQGADAISLLIREKYFFDDQILDHYKYIANKTDIPFVIHEMPFLSGSNGKQINWPESLLNRLLEIPQIIGIKEDAKDLSIAKLALKLEPNIRIIFAGTKNTFLPLKEYGLQSYLNGISIIDSRIGIEFWKRWKSNDLNGIHEIIEKIEKPFFEGPVSKYGWHRCNKAILEAAGYMKRIDRMPMPTLTESQYEEVLDCYKKIKFNLNHIIYDQ